MNPALECAALLGHLAIARLAVDLLMPLWPARLRWLIGFGLWPAPASAGLLFRLLAARPTSSYARTVELIAIGGLSAVLAFLLVRRRRGTPRLPPPAPPRRDPLPPLLAISVLLALVCALGAFVLASLANPHGGWDAWITWNLRARQLFLAGAHWQTGFGELPGIHHPDYPLLLPGFVTRLWLCAGTQHVAAPVLVAMGFTFGTVALTTLALGSLRGATRGALGALALLGTPALIAQGALQYADVPLAFFVLASLVTVALALESGGAGAWVLTGLLAGCAAWTKNEGMLLAPALAVVSSISVARTHGSARAARTLGLLAAGVLPAAVPVVLFKTLVTAENDLVASSRLGDIGRSLGDPSRWLAVLEHVLRGVRTFGGIVPLLLTGLVLGLLLLRDRSVPRSSGKAATTVAATLGILILGDVVSYVITPHDLHWHVSTSLDRLLLQLWPGAAFALLLAEPGSPREASRALPS